MSAKDGYDYRCECRIKRLAWWTGGWCRIDMPVDALLAENGKQFYELCMELSKTVDGDGDVDLVIKRIFATMEDRSFRVSLLRSETGCIRRVSTIKVVCTRLTETDRGRSAPKRQISLLRFRSKDLVPRISRS